MSLRRQLKQAWNAFAYGEEGGEFLPYAEKCRLLGVAAPEGYRGYLPPREQPPQRLVALNLSHDLEPITVAYAIGTAQRLEAGLILLRLPNSPPEAVVQAARQQIQAAGVHWGEIDLTPPWLEGITDFLSRHPSVVCLVLGAEDLKPQRRPSPSLRAATPVWPFQTPVVVVEGNQPLPQPI